MSEKKRPLPLQIFFVIWCVVKTLLLTYAIAFSIAGTIALYITYNFVTKPIKEVQALKISNPTKTAYMQTYQAELDSLKKPDTLINTYIPLDSISPFLKFAVLAAEDDGFYTHPGFDIEAMLSAIDYNKSHKSLKRGASTITQQLAKNLFLSREKSFERKFKELAYTLLMEKYLGKDRILELYLNYAQWGKNIFGCEAASKTYYNKSSHNLSRSEAARMAAVLAMPTRITPLSTHSVFIGKRIAVIANNLYLRGELDDSGYVSLTGSLPPGKDTIADSLGEFDTLSRNLVPINVAP